MSSKELTSEASRLLDQATALLEVFSVADFNGDYILKGMDGVAISDAADGIKTLVDLAREKIEEANEAKPRLVGTVTN